MTKLAPNGTRSPMRGLDEDEASTYRKWAKVWYIIIFVALAVIVTADLARQGAKDDAITLVAIP